MRDFMFYAPTKVVFGKGTEEQAGMLAKEAGATKVLVHYGSGSAVKSGLIDRVVASLGEEGLGVVQLGGVVPNPHLTLVYEGIELCRAEGVDFILAVGGGSVIDSAKAISYGVPYEGDVWDFYDEKAHVETALPVGVVLTVAAAGSEMSNSSVITQDTTNTKRGYNHQIFGRPKFAIMDPALTATLPAYPTACGVADIMMHTIERYFAKEANMELTMGMAEALVRTTMDFGRVLARKPADYNARAEVMWAGSLSHNGLMACGGSGGDWACHQMGHELSGMFDVAHGASLTALWGSWARYVMQEDVSRFARFALEVLDVADEGSDEEVALAGIEEMESFFWALELPTSIADLDLGIGEAEIEQMADRCSRGGTRTVGGLKKLEKEDMLAIYRSALVSQQD